MAKHMKYLILILITLINFQRSSGQGIELPEGFVQEIMAENLNPTAMAFDHHGNAYLAQKDGRVLLVSADGTLQPDPVLSIPVDDFNERGVSGIALHPDFDNLPYLYLYYTVPDSNYNRVSRFLINGTLAVPGSEQVIFNFDKLNSGIHNGGSMVFGKDGNLYVGTGDGGKSSNAQSLDVTLGKIIRIQDDGGIPDDNPFINEVQGRNQAIYAYGLRNPFSMALEPETGQIFVSEVGQGAFEEVNEIVSAKNYGWSLIEGPLGSQTAPQDYQDPFFAYPHNQGCAIVGAAIYKPTASNFPSEYLGKYYFADYCNGYLMVLDLQNGVVNDTFARGLKQPVAFAINPLDGSFWYLMRSGIGGGSIDDNTATNNGTLWKVTYTGSGAPFISVNPGDEFVPDGESARFEVQAFGSQPLHYQWQINGVNLPASDSPVLQFHNASLIDHGSLFRCIVSNVHGADTSASAELRVTSNQRPIPEILQPITGLKYQAGDTIRFQGFANDPETGILPDSSLEWHVDFHHDTHTHPVVSSLKHVASGAFIIPQAGETSINTWYRIYLKAKDSEGLEQTTFREIYPAISEFSIEGPNGLLVNVDGLLRPMPYTFESLQKQQHIAQASEQMIIGDSLYLFEKWLERNDHQLIHTFNAPDTQSLTLHALYSSYKLGNGTGLHGEYFIDPEFDLDEDPAALRLDTMINFNWGNTSPFPGLIPNDGFTVRWTGFVLPYFTGIYNFHVNSDDGCRLWIGDSLVIDKWVAQANTENSGSIYLDGGQQIPIILEYLEIGGGANISMKWSGPNTPKALVPKKQLYPPPPYEPATIKGTVWHDLNYDQAIDTNEPLMANTTVLLFSGQDSSIIGTTITGSSGNYKFSGLASDAYFLRFLPASNFSNLIPGVNLDSLGQTVLIQLDPLQSQTLHVSFETPAAEIQGLCFHDLNLDGQPDPGEIRMPGVSVFLFQAPDTLLVGLKQTDLDGRYIFKPVGPGDYFLNFYDPFNAEGLIPSTTHLTNGFSPVIPVSSGQSATVHGPFVSQPGHLLGKVWLDGNGNSFADQGEAGIQGIVLLLYSSDSTFIDARSTNAEGDFVFYNLPAGTYFFVVSSNTIPASLEPSFGVNTSGVSPMFDIHQGSTRAIELGYKPLQLGSNELNEGMDIQIYPNPVHHRLSIITSADLNTPLQISIFDLTGKKVTSSEFDQSDNRIFTLNVDRLAPGMYFIHFDTQFGQLVKRFMKN